MRSVACFSIACALVLGSGCSLLYSGSRYTNGSATDGGPGHTDMGTGPDAGMPDSTTGMPDMNASMNDAFMTPDARYDDGAIACTAPGMCPMGTACIGGVCEPGCERDTDCPGAHGHCDITTNECVCVANGECPADSYCDMMHCTLCDNDADGYYDGAITQALDIARCSGVTHGLGGDCNDDDATVHPFARADCSTPTVECCPISIALPTPPGMPVREAGITPVHVLFHDDANLHLGLPHLGVSAGNDAPTIAGMGGGFVAVALQDTSTMSRSVQLLPLAFDGAASTPLMYFNGFDVQDLAVGLTIQGSQPYVAVGIAGGGNQQAYAEAMRGMPLSMPSTATSADPLLLGQSMGGAPTFASVAIADWVQNAAAATILNDSTNTPYLINFDPTEGHRTGGANVRRGTWLAGAGAALMWVANDTSVGIWNGAQASISPPTVDLSAYVSPMGLPPTAVQSTARGALAVSYDGSTMPVMETFLGVIPVGDTTTMPHGRIVLLRWSAPQPQDSTTAPATPTAMQINELMTSGAIQAQAGAAAVDVGGGAVIAYQDGSNIMVRTVGYSMPTSLPEDPPAFALMSVAAGELVETIAIDKGFWPNDPLNNGQPIGRILVLVQVRTATGREIRVRALEGCF